MNASPSKVRLDSGPRGSTLRFVLLAAACALGVFLAPVPPGTRSSLALVLFGVVHVALPILRPMLWWESAHVEHMRRVNGDRATCWLFVTFGGLLIAAGVVTGGIHLAAG